MLIQSLDAVLQSWAFEPPEHLLGAMSEKDDSKSYSNY